MVDTSRGSLGVQFRSVYDLHRDYTTKIGVWAMSVQLQNLEKITNFKRPGEDLISGLKNILFSEGVAGLLATLGPGLLLALEMLCSAEPNFKNRLGLLLSHKRLLHWAFSRTTVYIYIYGAWDVCCPHFRHVPLVGFGV